MGRHAQSASPDAGASAAHIDSHPADDRKGHVAVLWLVRCIDFFSSLVAVGCIRCATPECATNFIHLSIFRIGYHPNITLLVCPSSQTVTHIFKHGVPNSISTISFGSS